MAFIPKYVDNYMDYWENEVFDYVPIVPDIKWYGDTGIIFGGYSGTAAISTIDKININNKSNSISFGNTTKTISSSGASSNNSIGVFGGGVSGSGSSPIYLNSIYYI